MRANVFMYTHTYMDISDNNFIRTHRVLVVVYIVCSLNLLFSRLFLLLSEHLNRNSSVRTQINFKILKKKKSEIFINIKTIKDN